MDFQSAAFLTFCCSVYTTFLMDCGRGCDIVTMSAGSFMSVFSDNHGHVRLKFFGGKTSYDSLSL